MPVRPDALVLTCSDSRLHRPEKPYLAEYLQGKHVGLRTWDLAALPGGNRDLAGTGTGAQKEALLHAVKTAHDTHGITRVLLINHSDCEAYGGARAFADATEEFRAHADDLRAARQVLREALPNLDIRLFFATVEDRSDGPFVTFDEVH